MKLAELDVLIEGLHKKEQELETKHSEAEKARSMQSERELKQGLLEKYANITGEPVEGVTEECDVLKKLEADIKGVKEEIIRAKSEVSQAIENITFPIDYENAKINKNTVTYKFKDGNDYLSIKYLIEEMGIDNTLEIDGVKFLPNMIVVQGVSTENDAVERLCKAVCVIKTYGSVAQGKETPEIKRMREWLSKSKYREYWEILAMHGQISLSKIYKQSGITDKKKQSLIKQFFVDLRHKHGVSPLGSDGHGNYWLTRFGKLVWASYQRYHPVDLGVKPPEQDLKKEAIAQKELPEKEKTKNKLGKTSTLNTFFGSVLQIEENEHDDN